MPKEDQLEIAAAAHAELEALHARFMAAVSSLKEPNVNGAEFTVAESELQCTCLGIRMKARHRLYVLDGMFKGLEYAFVKEYAGEWLSIWSMYLLPDQSVYSDSNGHDVICSMSNPYLASRLAPHLASALLASKIFAPRA